MRFRLLSTVSLASGALALAVALAAPGSNGANAAARGQQVPPRPTLEPTATALPTATPWPKQRDDDAPRYGRVTGTVIDRRTGAPAAKVKVMVGNDAVISDANGNYDHWMLVGTYAVVLDLSDGQGIPAQAAQQVAISSEAPAVQHLFFSSGVPVIEVRAAATAVPSATAEPVAASMPGVVPERLPTTGDNASFPALSLWLALLLVAGGSLLSVRRVRFALLPWLATGQANRDNTPLLGALLTAHPQRRTNRAAPKADSALLESLFEREV